jgi:DNA-binding transcriptional LysR family regulator
LTPLQWVFAAAPSHPIVAEQQPLTEAVITRYRAISVADSSRNTPPRTVGLISGQDVLTVATMTDKLEAQIAGLGVGYLPLHLAASALGDGKLVTLSVMFPRADTGRCVAWRANRTGKALRWFIHEFEKPEIVAAISNAS